MKIPTVRILLLAAFAAVYSGISGCQSSGTDKGSQGEAAGLAAEIRVKAIPVRLDDWKNTVPISGTLQTLSSVDIKTEVGGRLIGVRAFEGDLVRRGDLLAEIDDANYQLAYQQSNAALKVAQAGLERAKVSAAYAKTEKERADNLLRTGGITQKDHQAAIAGMQEAEAQVSLAEAQCLQAEATLKISEKALRDCSIHAPADGHVQKRWVDEGSLLIPGSAIFTVVDNSRLELKCVVPSYYLPSIKPGQDTEFTTPSWGNRTFKGVLSAINPMVQPENRSLVVKVKVQNPEMKLRSGMYARGFIATGKVTNVPVIPNDALIPEEGGASESADVFVVEGGVVKRRRIRLGGKGRDKVWVQGGLNAGDLLVIERGPSLEEGLKVRVETDGNESGS